MKVSCLAGIVAAAALALPAGAAARNADSVYLHGKVFTADDTDRVAAAFAVTDGRFVAVGTDKQVRCHIGPETKVVDLHGAFVVPGLGDAHFHNEGGGPGIDLSRSRSLAELLATVGQAARAAGPGKMLIANADWHEAQLREQRLPTAAELDRVAPENPVILLRGGHTMILNGTALRKFSITPTTPVPPGGSMPRGADGALTGELTDGARALVTLPEPAPISFADLERTQRTLNRFGITAVRIPGAYKGDLRESWRLMQEADRAGKLTLRYTVYLPGFALQSGDDARRLIAAWGVVQDEGNDWLRIGGVKLAVDGGFEGGHMRAPYAEPYGRGGRYHGLTSVAPDAFRDVVTTLHAMGWRVTTHAVGDAAVEEVLNGYAAADAASPIAGRRWAIEHAFITDAAMVSRMKALGIDLSVQDHLYLAAPVLKRYWGEDRARMVTPLRSYLDAGLVVAGGTDAPVVPFNPFWALYHFATRDTISDGIYGPEERVLSRSALLRLMTINYARLIGEEDRKGSIEAGKIADFAILSDDFLTVPANRIPDMHALATYVGGREVFRDPDWR